MRAIGVIPARMASTRFPGKPLAKIGGREMLLRVWDVVSASRLLWPNYVATPDHEIALLCIRERIPFIVTAAACSTGTERVIDAMRQPSFKEGDVVVNVQGDEPTVRPESLDALVEAFADPEVNIASLYFHPENAAGISDRNRVKVLVDEAGDALCFTRSASAPMWRLYGIHVGVYAFRRRLFSVLREIPPDVDLEQNAWMRAGLRLHMIEIPYATAPVDCPGDVAGVETKTAKSP